MAYIIKCSYCKKEIYLFNLHLIKNNPPCPSCKKILIINKIKKNKIKKLKCKNCGLCCQFVPEITNKEYMIIKKYISNINDYIYIKDGSFYPYIVNKNNKKRKSLVKINGFYCIFFDINTHLCKIHNYKPDECKKLEPSFKCLNIQKLGIDFSLI